MGKNGGVNFRDLERLKAQLSATDDELSLFIDSCAKELASRLLAKVTKRTPVGQYPAGSGKKGGTLRRNWTGGKGASNYAQSLKVNHFGNTYVIEIVNPTEYASYVEFGHRTRGGKGWVAGKFMLTISEQEIENSAPAILEKKNTKLYGGLLQMINKIISGISEAIFAEFGNDYEIYTESIEQGLQEPCFSIICLNPTNELFLGKQYKRTNQFMVQFFPASSEPKQECMDILEELFYCLEMIDIDGQLVRGSKMNGEMTNGILSFQVNFDMFTQVIEEIDNGMNSYEVGTSVRKDDVSGG